MLLGLAPILWFLRSGLLAIAGAGAAPPRPVAVRDRGDQLTGWSVITPAFQAPDEVDHFAYVQSLAERGHKPSPYPQIDPARWSTSEQNALLGAV